MTKVIIAAVNFSGKGAIRVIAWAMPAISAPMFMVLIPTIKEDMKTITHLG